MGDENFVTQKIEENRNVEAANPIALTLGETINGMLSSDYKERFKAEYNQLKIRYDALLTMISKAKAGTLEFTPTTPLNTLEDQLNYMYEYMKILRIRAELEHINLFGEEIVEKTVEPEEKKDSEPVMDESTAPTEITTNPNEEVNNE